jgi:hypothetical protein
MGEMSDGIAKKWNFWVGFGKTVSMTTASVEETIRCGKTASDPRFWMWASGIFKFALMSTAEKSDILGRVQGMKTDTDRIPYDGVHESRNSAPHVEFSRQI